MKKSRNIFERLFKEKKENAEQDTEFEGEFKSQAAEELYRKIKKC